MTRLSEKSWTDEQNLVLKDAATKLWKNKQELVDFLATTLPITVSGDQAYYHATQHLGLAFNTGRMTEEAIADSIQWLAEGNDSAETQKQVQTKYGIYMNLMYYNQRRFHLERGEYLVIPDTENPGKMLFQHTINMEEVMGKNALKGKVVMHHNTVTISTNKLNELTVVTRSEMGKIRDLNKISRALGLGYGIFTEHMNPGELQTKTAQSIATRLLKESGVSATAEAYFKSKPVKVVSAVPIGAGTSIKDVPTA
jgi:hypothetical protein